MKIESVRAMLRLERERLGADDDGDATPLPLVALADVGYEVPRPVATPTRVVTLELLEGSGSDSWPKAA